MIEIKLTKGLVAIVDDCDSWVLNHKWVIRRASFKGKRDVYYALTKINGRFKFLHRMINKTPNNMVTDHIDCDTMNNTRANLRSCTHSENCFNRRGAINSKSKYKGAWKRGDRWNAQIRHKGKKYTLGGFSNEIEAARAYDKKAIELHGEFARTNL